MALPHPIPDPLAELIAERLALLAHPMRVKIVDRMQTGELNVQQLAVAIGTTQQNASKHVRRLHDAGILVRRRDGRQVFYAASKPGAVELLEAATRI